MSPAEHQEHREGHNVDSEPQPPRDVFVQSTVRIKGCRHVHERENSRWATGVRVGRAQGYGGSTAEPLLGLLLDDVTAIIEAAVPPERVVVMGRPS